MGLLRRQPPPLCLGGHAHSVSSDPAENLGGDVCPPPTPHLGREHTAALTLSSPNHNSCLTYVPPGGWILGPQFPPSALSPKAQKLGVGSPDSQGHVAWVAGISGVNNAAEMGFLELGQSLHPCCWFPASGRAQGTRAWMEGG